MKKRLVSVLLALAMCMGLAVPAVAAEEPDKLTVEQVEAEIQFEKERIYDIVYEQLEAQGALGLMDSYKEILDSQIKLNIIMKHAENGTLPENIAVPYSRTQYYFPYGGMISSTSIATGAENLCVYMDRDHTLYYLLNGTSSFVVYDLLISIYGVAHNVPVIGSFFSILSALSAFVSEITKRGINDANGYAYAINVYDPMSEERGSVVLGWDNYPFAYTDTQLEKNIEREFFPESDPWAR